MSAFRLRLYRLVSCLLAATLGIVLLPATAAHAAAVAPTRDAAALGSALTAGQPSAGTGLLQAATFDTIPPQGDPAAVSDVALADFPTDLDRFAILTTGDANLADDPNASSSSGASDGGGSVRGDTDFDVTVLHLTLNVPAGPAALPTNCLQFDFRFFSEEFPEYKNSAYNDAFIAELDPNPDDVDTSDDPWRTSGSSIIAPDNFAYDEDGNEISINSLGEARVTAPNADGTTYDGATASLVASTPVTSGTHHLYLSIFDQGDSAFDSAVFLDGLSAGHAAPGGCTAGARRQINGLSITTTGEVTTTPTGVVTSPLGDIPLTGVSQHEDPAPVGTAPFGKAPFGKAPFGKAPFGKAPFGKAPFGKAPFGKAPFGKAPFGKAPFGKAPLAEYPILRTGGWEGILAQTCSFTSATPQSVTWQQLWSEVETCLTVPPPLDPGSAEDVRLTLDEVMVASSPLADFPLLAFLMGTTSWEEVTRDANDWGSELLQIPGCEPVDVTASIAEGAAEGCDLGLTTLANRTIGDLLNPSETAFWDLTISQLNIKQSFLGDVAISAIPALSRPNVVNCSKIVCATETLRDVANTVTDADPAGAWAVAPAENPDDDDEATGTFADLGAAVAGATLSDLVIAFLDPTATPIETTPLGEFRFERLPSGDPTNFVTYRVDLGVRCTESKGLDVFASIDEGFTYAPGSSKLSTGGGALAPLADPTETTETTELSWQVTDGATSLCPAGQIGEAPVSIRFDAMPGFELGTFSAGAGAETASIARVDVAAGATAQVEVVESLEPDGIESPATAQPVSTNAVVFSHLNGPDDVDYFAFDVPTGDSLDVSLSHLSRDYQIVLYAPDGSSQTQSLRPDTDPLELPVGVEPQVDPAGANAGVLPPPALQDIPFSSGSVLSGISDFRGTDPEFLSTIAVAGTDGDATYVAQVSGANGVSGPEPYALTIRSSAPVQLPPTPRRFSGNLPDTFSTLPTTVSSNVNTLVLYDRRRMVATYGLTAAVEIEAALLRLTTVGPTLTEPVEAVIVPTDTIGTDAAFDAWDATPSSPELMNNVVRAINSEVDSLRDDGVLDPAAIKNVVIVGEGDLIPHAAIVDGTADGNEIGFVGETIFGGQSNHLTGAFATKHFLSDAPYGALVPLSLKGQLLYLPQASVGRLFGGPTKIVEAIDQFLAEDGMADPRTATTDPRTAFESDYDFFVDGGGVIASALNQQVGNTNFRRLTPTGTASWDRDDFAAEVDGTATDPDSAPPHILSPNGHFDQYRMLPADGGANDTDVYSTADLPSALQERILFSIGCHFGLNYPGSLPGATTGDPRLFDWQEALAGGGAAVTIGNFGYGIGDTATVGFQEVILGTLAENLDGSMTVGEGLQDALRDYMSSMPSFTPYDLKILQELGTGGMPMYRVPGDGTASVATVDDPQEYATDIDGVDGIKVTVNSAFTQETTSDGRTFFSNAGEVQTTHPYPIVPKVTGDVDTLDGQVAHGAFPLSWEPVTETQINSGEGYAFANATYDGSAIEDAPAGRVVYPTAFGNVGTWYETDGTPHHQLVVLTGQFRSNENNNPAYGTFREYPTGDWVVTYASEDVTDFLQPRFSQVSVLTTGTIEATVNDEAGVAQVFAQILDGDTYTRVPLSDAGGGTWRATGAFTGDIDEVTLFAIDINGNVGTANNGGPGFVAVSPDVADVSLHLSGNQVNDIFVEPVTVTVSPANYKVKIDTANPVDDPVVVATDGTHTATVYAPDGIATEVTETFTIDTGNPTITITTPKLANPIPMYVLDRPGTSDAPVFTNFTCNDGPNGAIASCVDLNGNPSGAELDRSTLGLHTFTVTARDTSGHVATLSRQYRVVKFEGFFAPVDNPDVTNTAKAGTIIPVKWRITDENGAGIADPGSFVSITATKSPGVTCQGTDDAIETFSGSSGLRYLGDGNWVFNWKTNKNYTGNCFVMSLNLYDGTPTGHSAAIADFRFK